MGYIFIPIYIDSTHSWDDHFQKTPAPDPFTFELKSSAYKSEKEKIPQTSNLKKSGAAKS